MQLQNLFEEVVTKEAAGFNKFWDKLNKDLKEAQKEYTLKINESFIAKGQYNIKYEALARYVRASGFSQDVDDIIGYYERRHLSFVSTKRFLDNDEVLKEAIPEILKLRKKCTELNNSKIIELSRKISYWNKITEEIIINSVLSAFQQIVPKHEFKDFGLPDKLWAANCYPEFPWTHEVQDRFVDKCLAVRFEQALNKYMSTPIRDKPKYTSIFDSL